jgi:tetratricopeptide (TPR) repeat protein
VETSSTLAVDAVLREALEQHKAGRLAEAEQLYRQVLVTRPDLADVHVNLGIVLMFRGDLAGAASSCEKGLALRPDHARGHCYLGDIRAFQNRLDHAVVSYGRALAFKPDYAEAHNSLGNAFFRLGKLPEAASSYQKAIALRPDFAETHNNLGQVLVSLDRLDEAQAAFHQAIALVPGYAEAQNNLGYLLLLKNRLTDAENSLRRALAAKPDYAQAHCNLAAVLGKQRRFEEAAECCRRAIAIRPDSAEAHNNLGFILQESGALADAESAFRDAIALKPELFEAHQHLGVVLCESGRLAEGFDIFTRLAERKYATGEPGSAYSPHKLCHDQEQRAWLGSGTEGNHLGDGGRVAGAAVNPTNRVAEISTQWKTARPQIVVIDDLLTAEALEKLRRFCLDSTVWRKIYDGGYLGAFPEHGFAPPLLAQIAEELRAIYPAIIEDHPLLHFWAFKYDSRLGGIRKHADFAAVNVNFWITPDEANLDPAHGGLVVWDVAAPLDWDFDKYNAAEDDIRSFLAREKSKPVSIAYRANRAVIFDSDLFHETDTIRFKPGYENRRINVTLLFGRRQKQLWMRDHG